jgi:type I protein arginine methyltransferase
MTVDAGLNSQRSELGQHIPIHYHYQMLADTDRMYAFATAIRQRVKPGMRVADLGSGTGALSFFAAQCGASVWSVEAIPELAHLSQRFLHRNRVADRVEVVCADAATWLPPEPVDMVLCEMLHSALLREKQVAVLHAFREAHAQQFGTVPVFLPEATLLAVQPVTQDYSFDGFVAPVPIFQSAYFDAADCLPRGEPTVYATVDYDSVVNTQIIGNVACVVPHDAIVNALRFVTRSVLAMDTKTGTTVDWYNQHFIAPLDEPLKLEANQAVNVRFAYAPGDALHVLTDSLQVSVAKTRIVAD